jgi:hypothetical protein
VKTTLSWRVLCLICAAVTAVLEAQPLREPNQSELHKQAVAESLVPIHPGIPGQTPFWNTYSRRFIYAPAFDFKRTGGATYYRFTADARDGAHSFEADVPWAPLSPIWATLPVGKVTLKVQGLDQKGGKVVALAGERTLYRSAVFNGPYHKPAVNYRESARLSLRALFLKPAIQSWLRDGKPDAGYPLNCYPAKVIGATVLGMTLYSKLATEDRHRAGALLAARRAADFLIALSEPAGRPLEFLPPTYWDGVNPGRHPVYMDRTMMHYPADAALAYLDLYDSAHEAKYFQAARRIAETYRKTQLPSGVWPLVAKVETGEAIGPNLLVPTLPIMLMDRLSDQYGLGEYRQVAERAFRWIMENPVQRFSWDAQFEDSRPVEPYVNLSREQACDVAIRLFQRSATVPRSVALAEELLRFAEDQFVVWKPPRPEWKEIVYLGCNPDGDISAWFTPVVMEQYRCYGPVARSVAIMISAWQAAYKATGKALYLAKARSLANTLTIAQQFWGGGEYPTWVRRTKGENWLNNTVHTSRLMLDFASASAGNAR